MIRIEVVDAGVVVLTLNNPKNFNTLIETFWSEFRTILSDQAENGVRCVVLTGAGDRAFCAGGDLVSFAKLDSYDSRRRYMADCIGTFEAMEKSPLIIISAVRGLALGGGCELALASDFVIAAANAEFGLPEANFGLMPSYGAFRGAEVIGRQRIKHLICTGDRISGQRAVEIGLALEAHPAENVLERALSLAQTIASKAPIAVSACKRVVNRDIDGGAFAYSVDLVTAIQGTADVAEGLAAFSDRRKPTFRGN